MFKFLRKNKDVNLEDYFIDYSIEKTRLTELAIEIAVGKIADVISKLGFRVKAKNEDVSEILYQLNVKPNPNQNATDFWKQAIKRMITYDEGCLIVNLQNGIYIADTFQCDDSVIKERTYSNVSIIVDDKTYQLKRKFKASDVVHLRYTNPKVMSLLRSVNESNENAWNVAVNGFSSKAPKIRVNVPGSLRLQDKQGNVIDSNEYAQKIANTLSKSEVKAIVSSSGIDISTIDTKNTLSNADIKALREEVFTLTSMAFGIPKSVFYGESTDNSSEFFTYSCEPIISIIDNAINGAWLTKEEYIAGNRIYINRLNIKHIDVIDSANNLDKLYSNGWSFNDVLDLVDLPRIDEDWADERRFTKNYSTNIEGGE